MGADTLHIVGIVPPPDVFSTMMSVADQLQLVSPSSTKTILPHLCLTAVYDHADKIEAWKRELRTVVPLFRPFTIKVAEPVRMSNGPLPNNFSLPVPTTTELEAISRAVAALTGRHFPDIDKNGLRSMVDHIYLIENIPDHSRYFVVKRACQLWSPRTFEVDRIEILEVENTSIARDTILLSGANVDTDRVLDNLGEDHRWILAMMHAMGGHVESKLKYHKMLFLVDYEEMNEKNRLDYAPYTHGPWSSRLEALTRELERLGLVMYHGYTCNLSEEEGESRRSYSQNLPREREFIARCVRKHGGKSTTELQTYVHYRYPEWHVLDSTYLDD